MEDYVGNTLKINDDVVMIKEGFQGFCRGKIVSILPSGVTIQYEGQKVFRKFNKVMKVI